VTGALAEISFDEVRMRDAISSTMMATDIADYLVANGVSFRQAHEAVGALIREAETRGCELSALELNVFVAAHPAFEHDVFDHLDPVMSVSRRNLSGGTGPDAVHAQLETARDALHPVETRGNELNLQDPQVGMVVI